MNCHFFFFFFFFLIQVTYKKLRIINLLWMRWNNRLINEAKKYASTPTVYAKLKRGCSLIYLLAKNYQLVGWCRWAKSVVTSAKYSMTLEIFCHHILFRYFWHQKMWCRWKKNVGFFKKKIIKRGGWSPRHEPTSSPYPLLLQIFNIISDL